MITDERQNPDVCGLVTDTLSIDTSVINAQFTELLAQLRAAIEQAASGQIADGTITTPKYANKSVTAEKLADNIPYTKFGLAADQVRHVYAGTTEPGADLGSDGDIYLMYAN